MSAHNTSPLRQKTIVACLTPLIVLLSYAEWAQKASAFKNIQNASTHSCLTPPTEPSWDVLKCLSKTCAHPPQKKKKTKKKRQNASKSRQVRNGASRNEPPKPSQNAPFVNKPFAKTFSERLTLHTLPNLSQPKHLHGARRN